MGTARSVSGEVAPTTMLSCTTVATVERTAPATAGVSSEGCWRTREPIAPMVAELETKPEAKPASGSPRRGPSMRTAR